MRPTLSCGYEPATSRLNAVAGLKAGERLASISIGSGLRVATRARRSLAALEGAEAGECDGVASCHGPCDLVEDRSDGPGRLGAGQAGLLGDGGDELVAVHGLSCGGRG
jgi:hypothetical protein